MEDGLKISELTQTTTINDSDLIPIVQNDETKSITKEDLVADINNLIERNSTYSTTEQVVGTWENSDGTQQHIYRRIKYFTSTNLTTSSWTPLMALPNCKDLVMSRMGLTFNTADSSYSSVWNDVLCRYVNGNVEYYVEIGHKTNYIIIEYTKTTD